MRIRSLALALLLALGAAFFGGPQALAAYELVQAPLPDDPMGASIYKLDNGLTVYLTENDEEPRFYAEIAIRAGSTYDPPETTGLAHYLEHLLFKGTESFGTLDFEKERPHLDRIEELYEEHFREDDPDKRKEIYAEINEEAQLAAKYAVPNELDKTYKAMGGQGLNAHTSLEETVYKIDLPANRLEQWAVIESERFAKPVFRLFHTELETVYEEKNRSLDNNDRILWDALHSQLYKAHPYGKTVLGDAKDLKRPSLVKIRNFVETYCVPNNMAVAISGDIDAEQAIEVIDEHFSAWQRKELPERPAWQEQPLQGREVTRVTYPGQPQVTLAWRTVPQKHDDAEALMLLDMILDNSVAGLININLNLRQKVRQAGAFPYMLNDYGAQYLYGVPKEGQTLEEVEQLLLEQLEIVKAGEFDEELLGAIVTDFKKKEKASLESNPARVARMRDSFLSFETWQRTVDTIQRIGQLTKEDVVRVANDYFGEDYVAAFREDGPYEPPAIEKPQIDKIEIDPSRVSPFMQRVAAMDVNPIEPVYVQPGEDYEKVDAPGGSTFYYAPNPINDLFVFTVSVEKGTRHDERLAVAASLLNKAGAGDLSADALKMAWYKLGSTLGFSAGPNETTLILSGLDENFAESLELALQVVEAPHIGDGVLEELVSNILTQREDNKKDPASLHSALVQYNRYGEKSPFLTDLPSQEMQALTSGELVALFQSLANYDLVVTYTGSLSKDEVYAAAREQLDLGAPRMEPPDSIRLTARDIEDTEILLFDKETAQAQIRWETPGPAYDENRRPVSQLYNSYFAGGMGGIVFQELREARGLAYSAAARYLYGNRKGDEDLMVGVIGTQPDKALEATKAFFELADDMPKSQERFARSVESILNQYRTGRIGFREVIGTVRAWERLGLEPDPRQARFQGVASADLEDMLSFYENHIAGKPKLVSLLGPKARIDMQALAEFGEVTEVALDDIFVD